MIPPVHRPACLAALTLVVMVLALAPVEAQDPPAGTPPQTGAPPPQDRSAPPEPRPFDRVITKDAKSDDGVFTVHRIGEKLYYEIPPAQLNKEFLWVSQIARTTIGAGQGGQAIGSRVVKWERRGNRVLLRSIAYDIVAG